MKTKKGSIFIGEANSGKSRIVQEIRNYYGDSAVYLDGKEFKVGNKFLFGSCTEATKIIIIDDLDPKFPLAYFYNVLTGRFFVHKQNQLPFSIEIDALIIILPSNQKLTNLPQSDCFKSFFNVVEFPLVDDEFLITEIENEPLVRSSFLFLKSCESFMNPENFKPFLPILRALEVNKKMLQS